MTFLNHCNLLFYFYIGIFCLDDLLFTTMVRLNLYEERKTINCFPLSSIYILFIYNITHNKNDYHGKRRPYHKSTEKNKFHYTTTHLVINVVVICEYVIFYVTYLFVYLYQKINPSSIHSFHVNVRM